MRLEGNRRRQRDGAHGAAFAAMVILALAAPVAAAPEIKAEVDRYTLSTDDVLLLTVSLHLGARDDADSPQLEPGEDFTVVGTPVRETGYSIVNMSMTKYSRLTYTLQPMRSGELTVPAATVQANGRALRTQAISVQVTQGSATPSTDAATGPIPDPTPRPEDGTPFDGTPPFAVVCRADRTDVFVNEQIILDVDYYTAYRLPRSPGQEAPRAEGFVAEDLPDPEPQYVTVNGTQYARITNRWAVFPASSGKHTIAAAPEELMLPPTYSLQTFESNSLAINVKALPTPPAGRKFSGVVGQFAVQMAADKTQVKAGEGLTLRMIVDGTGNVQSISPPQLDIPDTARIYESGERRSTDARQSGERMLIGGRAEFEYLLVPRERGQLILPGAALTYFDPATGSYQTATSGKLTIDVSAGEVLAEEGVQTGEATIHHIHTTAPRLRARELVLLTPVPWAIAGICLLALGVAAYVRISADRRLADPGEARRAGAARAAVRALKRAESASGDDFFEAVGDGICMYLADKFRLPESGLEAREIQRELVARGVATDAANEVWDILQTCHACRFAPGLASRVDPAELLGRAYDVITAIQREGRGSR